MLSFLVVLLFSPAPVLQKEDRPTGPSPIIVSAQVDKEGRLVCFMQSTEFRQETRLAQVVVGGKVERRTYTVTVPVMTNSRTYSLDKATIAQVGGGKLDPKELAKRLEKPTMVVLSANGKPIDPAYLKVLRKDTIVIVVPSMAPAMGAPGLIPPSGPIPPAPVAPPKADAVPPKPKD